MKKTEPEYYPPVDNLLDLIYEHYTEKNPVEKNTVAGKAAKAKEKELEEWLRGLEGMDRLVDDYVGDKIPLWEKIMDRQGTVCCAWEKTAFEEGLKVGIRLMMEVYRTGFLRDHGHYPRDCQPGRLAGSAWGYGWHR